MGRSSAPEAAKPSARKRQLNLIYFVDSARTRSFSIPLGRLRLLGALLLLLITWSISSAMTIAWLHEDKADLAQRLQASLATIFEYESRYDRVFETAYPPEGRRASPSKAIATPSTPGTADAPEVAEAALEQPPAAAASSAAAAQLPSRPAPASAGAVPKPSVTTASAPAPKPSEKVAAVSTLEPDAKAAAAPASKPDESAAPAARAQELESLISITNPVLEPKDGLLELRFDLTNKSSKARAEGYLWVVAEFKTEDGQTMYLGAPSGIDVSETGEPRFPQRSASFGIKHYKKKSFTFPYAKNRPGTFTAIRIGVMDKTGSDRTTYNVPIEIRVPKGS